MHRKTNYGRNLFRIIVTKKLADYATKFITSMRSFMTQAPESDFRKDFAAIIYDCLSMDLA